MLLLLCWAQFDSMNMWACVLETYTCLYTCRSGCACGIYTGVCVCTGVCVGGARLLFDVSVGLQSCSCCFHANVKEELELVGGEGKRPKPTHTNTHTHSPNPKVAFHTSASAASEHPGCVDTSLQRLCGTKPTKAGDRLVKAGRCGRIMLSVSHRILQKVVLF